MMGVLDYFARYLGYTSIMNDATNSDNRIALAYHVFMNTDTYQWGLFSGGDKSTFTDPDDYVKGFNTLMKDYYHLDKQIKAVHTGGVFVSKSSKINKIKQAIDKGYPATIYVGMGGDGTLGNHYVNAYEYEVWTGIDRNGNTLTKTIFNVRLNFGYDESDSFHMDADLLDAKLSGAICYDVIYDNQLIRPSDFANDFVNANGQGQYYFYEKKADITTANGFKFGTARLRCGYIENEYLVLSATREGAGKAYLEMNFNVEIKAINFDICLWSSREGYLHYIKLYYRDETGVWQECYNIDPVSTIKLKQYPDNHYVSFPTGTTGIKFEVSAGTATSETNKGRVVLGDMNLFY